MVLFERPVCLKGCMLHVCLWPTQRYQSKTMSPVHEKDNQHNSNRHVYSHVNGIARLPYKMTLDNLSIKSRQLSPSSFQPGLDEQGNVLQFKQQERKPVGLEDQPSQVVAVYHFVIIDRIALSWVDPLQGVWISRTLQERTIRTPHAWSTDARWKATFGCAYSDAGVLESLEVLDANDGLMQVIDWKLKNKAGGHLEVGPSQGASETLNEEVKELGKNPFPRVMLGAPSLGQNDDNGNKLLCFSLVSDSEGTEGGQQEEKALWWATKEVPGKPITALSEEELERFKFDGRFEQVRRGGTIEVEHPPDVFQRMPPIFVDRLNSLADWR